jgi:site-specific recombinase XerD
MQVTLESLLISGKSRRTAETYSREVQLMAKWLDGKPLAEATEEDLRQYYLYRLQECELKGSSLRILICGLRELFVVVMGRLWPIFDQLWAKRTDPLPTVLERDEVWRLIASSPSLCHQTYFTVIYGCGLRMSEALNLTIHDIQGKREPRQLIVRNGKGGKDRIVPLPKTVYFQLRKYWATHRNPKLLFPAGGRDGSKLSTATVPMPCQTVQGALRRYAEKAGVYRPGVRIHTLRHCYATHLLEGGVSVHAVRDYLGHVDLSTTLQYLHLTRTAQVNNLAAIESVMTPTAGDANA